MEHSVQAYLKRVSTEKLEVFLRQYSQEKETYDHIIPLILAELEQRKHREST